MNIRFSFVFRRFPPRLWRRFASLNTPAKTFLRGIRVNFAWFRPVDSFIIQWLFTSESSLPIKISVIIDIHI